MSKPKPNTMDDLVNEIIRTVKNGDFHGTIEINPIGGKVGKSNVKTSHEVIEQLITAKLNEVDRAARADELANFEPFFKGDHSKCPDPKTCIGYQNAQSDFDNEKQMRLASLKGWS